MNIMLPDVILLLDFVLVGLEVELVGNGPHLNSKGWLLRILAALWLGSAVLDVPFTTMWAAGLAGSINSRRLVYIPLFTSL